MWPCLLNEPPSKLSCFEYLASSWLCFLFVHLQMMKEAVLSFLSYFCYAIRLCYLFFMWYCARAFYVFIYSVRIFRFKTSESFFVEYFPLNNLFFIHTYYNHYTCMSVFNSLAMKIITCNLIIWSFLFRMISSRL